MHQQTPSMEDSHVRPTMHALEPLNAEMWHGKLYDELGDESRALWKELGGTDTAFEVWSKPTTKGQEIAEGIWEKPTRQLPEFELVDLSGKTWRLKGLTGRAVLINVWATWWPLPGGAPAYPEAIRQSEGSYGPAGLDTQ
jgi:hypothetical protein